ncbi:aromatic ring-hydroxylating dioxygenase subunit alpha [Brachyspira alvinipulli]|uniref:aromatic ring-hydroxylating dioxygenase subunit alpha n=1 Tax=Brachyspira alvinipulli TaxID=84379 RepID=UPI003004C341
MIYNMWYAVLDSKEVKQNKPLFAKRLNKNLVFWRDSNNNICCIDDKCCHRGASLSHGKICGNNVACPFHGFQFDKSGKTVMIPANGRNTAVDERFFVEGYEVRDLYGFIWFWYGDKDKINDKIMFPDDLKDKKFSYSTIRDEWNNHYTRCIENQLDVVHVSFVHYNTIGRGNKTIVNGPLVELENDVMKFYVNNVIDNGQKALSSSEMKKEDFKYFLYFYFPNTWQNYIFEKMRIFGVFAPVDDENTVVYMRFYQKIVNIPFIKSIINLIGKKYSDIVLKQDKNVVKTQSSKESYLGMPEEKLIAGDMPIIVYRSTRDKFKKSNNKD